jgi:hypothetical protein
MSDITKTSLSTEEFENIKTLDHAGLYKYRLIATWEHGCRLDCEELDSLYRHDLDRLHNENEQLKGQAAKYKAVLKSINKYLQEDAKCTCENTENGLIDCATCKMLENVGDVLSTNTEEYHNPADVEALQQIMKIISESIDWIKNAECRDDLDGVCARLDEALVAIDKAIDGGGKGE